MNGDDAGGQKFPRRTKSSVSELLVGADAWWEKTQTRCKHVRVLKRSGEKSWSCQLTDDAGTFQQQVDGVRRQYGDKYQEDSETHRQTTGQVFAPTQVDDDATKH